jgi:hypothetical protein
MPTVCTKVFHSCFTEGCVLPVDDMWIKWLVVALQRALADDGMVCIPGFLPTMKPQLSQLPLIVGYGRVKS